MTQEILLRGHLILAKRLITTFFNGIFTKPSARFITSTFGLLICTAKLNEMTEYHPQPCSATL